MLSEAECQADTSGRCDKRQIRHFFQFMSVRILSAGRETRHKQHNDDDWYPFHNFSFLEFSQSYVFFPHKKTAGSIKENRLPYVKRIAC